MTIAVPPWDGVARRAATSLDPWIDGGPVADHPEDGCSRGSRTNVVTCQHVYQLTERVIRNEMPSLVPFSEL